MAQHKDAIKRIRQNEKRRMRNRHYMSLMRGRIKVFRATVDKAQTYHDKNEPALAKSELDKAQELFPGVVSIIQRVTSKGVIHRNQASRKVRRLHASLHGLENSLA